MAEKRAVAAHPAGKTEVFSDGHAPSSRRRRPVSASRRWPHTRE
jgi:hypothetical protein